MFGIEDFSRPIIDFSNFQLYQIPQAFVFGASVLLIGIITVFSVLCILWLFLILFKLVFHDLPKKRPKKETLTPVVANESSNKQSDIEEGELIAVIAAAIAYAENENPDSKFRVVSFRRT